VNNASTDESCALVERISDKHSHVRLVRFLHNNDVNAAINRGLPEAWGGYVCVSATDDVVTPSFAAESLELMSQYPTAGCCFSDRAQLLCDHGIVKRLPPFLSDRPCMFLPEAIVRLLKSTYFRFVSNTILYRRDALSAIGGFNKDLRWYADWFADYVMAFRHGTYYVPEVLAIYRVSPGSYYARGVHQSEPQRELIYRILDALTSNPWEDVARSFHSGAPTRRSLTGPWLHLSASGRGGGQ
jgi:GT2 family glycosyltransferase